MSSSGGHRHRSSSQASSSSHRRRESGDDDGSEYAKQKKDRERKDRTRDESRESYHHHHERRESERGEETKEERRARKDREKAERRRREQELEGPPSSRGYADTSTSRGVSDPTAAYGGSPYGQDPNYQTYPPPPPQTGTEYPPAQDSYGGDREYPAHSVTGQYPGGQYGSSDYSTYPPPQPPASAGPYGQGTSFDASGYPIHDTTSPAQGYSSYPPPPATSEQYAQAAYQPPTGNTYGGDKEYPSHSVTGQYGSSEYPAASSTDPYASGGYPAPAPTEPYPSGGYSQTPSSEPYTAAQYAPAANQEASEHEHRPPSEDFEQHAPGGFPSSPTAETYPKDQYAVRSISAEPPAQERYPPPASTDPYTSAAQTAATESYSHGNYPSAPTSTEPTAHERYPPPATSDPYAVRPQSGQGSYPHASSTDPYAARPQSGQGAYPPASPADPYAARSQTGQGNYPPTTSTDPFAATGNYPPPPSTDPYATTQSGQSNHPPPPSSADPYGQRPTEDSRYQSEHSTQHLAEGFAAGAVLAAGATAAGQTMAPPGAGADYGRGSYAGSGPPEQDTYGPPQQQGYSAPLPPPPMHHSSSELYISQQQGDSAANASYGAPDFRQTPEAPRNPDSAPNYHLKAEPSGPPPAAAVPYTSMQEEYEYPLPPQYNSPKKTGLFGNLGGLLTSVVHDFARDFSNSSAIQDHHHTHTGSQCTNPEHFQSENRFGSFAQVRRGNMAKWFVDGKDYFYAVSCALEKARESIWILDWWLSPEIYLRRPPAYNQQYRLDRMLQAAAQRGVKINIIVYKEVPQALTLDSAHTKHTLEALHPNIAVFRHPDHLPDRSTLASTLSNAIKTGNVSLQKALSGFTTLDDSVVLYWAHHEKLCLIDGTIAGGGIAFMGGLDMCWGRWDLAHHPISDTHPTDDRETLFLGQDYNNARIMDFQTVDKWDENKLNRTEFSRIGWSDVSLCLTGPTVEDLKIHFVDRWNFIYEEKAGGPNKPLVHDLESFLLTTFDLHQYGVRKDARYQSLVLNGMAGDTHGFEGGTYTGAYGLKGKMKEFAGRMRRSISPAVDNQRRSQGHIDALAFGGSDSESSQSSDDERSKDPRRRGGDSPRRRSDDDPRRGPPLQQQQQQQQPGRGHRAANKALSFLGYAEHDEPEEGQGLGIQAQLVRSCTMWSNGTKTEHSIMNAYIEIISAAKHFIYIENQFFITVTGAQNGPVKNKIGEAIVDRIVLANQNNEKFRMIVCIPSVPGFAGDLKDSGSLGTRAIMEFQYDGISHASKVKGSSIYERLAAKGINPYNYIRFFNLRNYDRINISSELEIGEQQAGFRYDSAQQDMENKLGAGYKTAPSSGGEANKWQQGSQTQMTGVADSVAQCAFLGGGDIRDTKWAGNPQKEMDAFVSEELYIHTKLLIADDRVVICGSANFNDRSQLGEHDSEIAIILEDNTPLASLMNNQPYTASHYAGTLRRYLFRKHLGLVPAQSLHTIDDNMKPVPAPNVYDFDSPEDELVMDPLSDRLWDHWNSTAKTNTDAFAKVFHPVPSDGVRNWKDYDQYFGQYFHPPKGSTKEHPIPARYPWGHVVKDEFPGPNGVRDMKDVLSRIRGTLVEMPMNFLKDENIAREGVDLNAFTEEIYT